MSDATPTEIIACASSVTAMGMSAGNSPNTTETRSTTDPGIGFVTGTVIAVTTSIAVDNGTRATGITTRRSVATIVSRLAAPSHPTVVQAARLPVPADSYGTGILNGKKPLLV
jgi:hypothetical protein